MNRPTKIRICLFGNMMNNVQQEHMKDYYLMTNYNYTDRIDSEINKKKRLAKETVSQY